MDERRLIVELAAKYRLGEPRFAAVGPTPRFGAFREWLAAGHHGDMHYLARTQDIRADPRRKLASARTAIVFTLRHAHERPPDPGGRTGLVARYAWGRDYHNLLGKRLDKLARDVRQAGYTAWGGVDAAPIVERAWAEAAGAGAVGKNNLVLQPGRGSWAFLAVLFVSAEIAPDAPAPRDPCGTCTRCLVGCPTQAFVAARSLDATRCIAYWTIEARGVAPEHLRPAFGRWIFGCDICQEVCPHNHAPPAPDELDLLPRNAWLDLDELLSTPDEDLISRFTGSPLRRPGAVGLKRNAAIALGNLGDPGGLKVLADWGLQHPSATVREAAAWATARLTLR